MNNLENVRVLVLASLLSANEFGDIDLNVVMSSGINKEYFEDASHQSLFEVIKVCYEGSVAYDDSIVLNYLKKSGTQNPEALILNLVSQKSVPQNALMEQIGFLKEDYHRRLLAKLNADVGEMLKDESISSDAISQTIQNTIDGYASLSKNSSTKNLAEVRKMRKAAPGVVRIKTHIPFIDTVLTDKHGEKGLRNEGLVFISGLKQSGKTYVATRMIENISRDHAVLFGSMEFGRDLYDENVEQQQEDGFFTGNIENIHTFDDIYEVNAIIAEIRLQHKLHGIKIAVLDSMLRMTNNNPELKTDERRTSEMFSKLGKLSKELKIPIVVIVQSSKEDLKSSMISVKGSMNADHEAYVWFHLTKTKPKESENELRTVIWNKNKDTHKHPQQHLMFVPQTSDFYRVELDPNGNPMKPLDKFRRPPVKAIEYQYEEIPSIAPSSHNSDTIEMEIF